MRRLLVLLLVFAALIAGIVTTWSAGGLAFAGDAANFAPSAGPVAAPVAATDGAGAADDRPGEDANERAEAVAAPEVATDDTALDLVTILVVDGATGTPVPDADVVADDPDFRFDHLPPADRRAYQRILDPFASRARWGQRAKSDGQGRVRLRSKDYLTVHATRDDRYGMLQVQGSPPPGGHVLRLEPDLAVAVRVVDAEGRGLPDVPLSLTAEFVQSGAEAGDRSAWPAGYTDAGGNARIAHLQSLARDWRGRQPRNLRVFVSAIGLTETSALVQPASPAGPPVVLTLGLHGSVQVLLRDPRDRPLRESANANVSLSARDRESVNPWDDVGMSDAIVDEGALFAYVGLGLHLDATAWVDSTHATRSFDGPMRQGERIDVALSLAETGSLCIRGVVVDGDGAPRANVDLALSTPDNSDRLGWSHSDAEGRFAWYGSQDAIRETPSIRLVAPAEDGRTPAASAPLSLPANVQEIDLGRVALQATQVIARGRVTAWTTPLPKHTLTVEAWVPPREGNEGYWTSDDRFGVAKEPDGSFAVGSLQASPASALRLTIEAPSCRPVTPVDFTVGRNDLRVELQRGTGLVVRMVVAPAIEHLPVQLACQLEGLGAAPEVYAQKRGSEMVAEFSGLAPGDYRLTVRSQSVPVAVVDSLRLEPDAAPDARVSPLDLRGVLKPLRLRLLDANATVTDEMALLLLRAPATNEWVACDWVDHGVAQMAVAGAHVELAVIGQNLRPMHWQGPPGDVDLRVERPFTVNIEFADLPPLPTDAALWCSLTAAGGSPFAHRVGFGEDFDFWGLDPAALANGSATLALREAGAYQVSLSWHTDRGTEHLFTAACSLGPSLARTRIAVPPDVAQRLRERWPLR